MERERLTTKNSLQIAVLGILVSAVVSLGVIFTLRFLTGGRRRPSDGEEWSNGSTQGTPPPIQPAIGIEMPATIPQHFTEDVVIPGFTETGQDIELQDDIDGRSPEGV
jgi:hypothetical protein